MKKISKQKSKRHFKVFRLTILNENTLDTLFTMRLSKPKMWIYSLTLVILICALFYALLFATPVKHLLPGYLDPKLKNQILSDAFRLNALDEQVEKQEAYMSLFRAMVTGEYVMDTTINLDSLATKQVVELKQASETEMKYRQQYEEKEKYNLTAFAPQRSSDGWLFYTPINGKLTKAFSAEEKHYGIDMSTTSRQAVMSVLDGRIILATYTPDNDYVLMVQHNNDFVSVYSQLTEVLKAPGDEVKAGEAMAFVGRSAGKSNSHLHFELWYKGLPLNPEEYILFK